MTTHSEPSSAADSAFQTGTASSLRVALLGATRSIHTVRWANGLSERGYDVHLLSLDDPSSDIAAAVHQYKL
ncbi:glycosyltransferase, partial [Pseudomonas sp. SIMBA_059]